MIRMNGGCGRRRRWCKTCNQWQDIIRQSGGQGFGSCWTSPNTDCYRNTEKTGSNKGVEGKESAIDEPGIRRQQSASGYIGHIGLLRATSNSENTGQQARINGQGEKQFGGRNFSMGTGQWDRFPTVSPIHTRDDGISDRLDSSAISFSKWRNESIKAAGNAIVSMVVHQIFKAIQSYEQSTQPNQRGDNPRTPAKALNEVP